MFAEVVDVREVPHEGSTPATERHSDALLGQLHPQVRHFHIQVPARREDPFQKNEMCDRVGQMLEHVKQRHDIGAAMQQTAQRLPDAIALDVEAVLSRQPNVVPMRVDAGDRLEERAREHQEASVAASRVE